MRGRLLRHDLGIQIAVLGPQPRQLLAQLALVRSLHRPFGPSAEKPPALNPISIATADWRQAHPRPTASTYAKRQNSNWASTENAPQAARAIGQGVTFVSHLASLQH